MLSVRPFTCSCPRVFKVVVTAAAVGMLTAFFGVGGGFALDPALVLALCMPMPVAVGTSLLVITGNSATAFTARATGGMPLDWAMVLAVTAFAVLGSLLGRLIANRARPRHLTRAFARLFVAFAACTAVRTVPTLP